MKKQLFMLAITSILATSSAHAIVVYDPTAAGNAVRQINEARNQLMQLKAQVDQAKILYKSLNGTRGIVNLLENPLIIGKLPKNYQELYAGIKTAKNDKWAALYKLSENGKALSDATPANVKAAYDANIRNYNDAIEKSFDISSGRILNLEKFVLKINNTKDPKEIADLQARIAAEQGMINLDKMKFDMLKEIKALKEQTLRENASREWRESLTRDITLPKI
jgi:type IV secretion system protein VirB5